MRAVIAIGAGFILGVFAISLLELAYPFLDKKLFNSNENTLENFSLIWLSTAWLTGAFFAGLITSLIDAQKKYSLLTAVLLIGSAVINFVVVLHPWWFMIATIALFIPAALASNKLVRFLQKK